MLTNVVLLVVVATSIWVLADAHSLGAKRGVLGGGFLDSSAGAWFFGCLLVWIIIFPCYLAIRPKLVARKRLIESQRASSWSGAANPLAMQAWPAPAPQYSEPVPSVQSGAHGRGSVTDELERLHGLRQAGALTDAEFVSLKQRLL